MHELLSIIMNLMTLLKWYDRWSVAGHTCKICLDYNRVIINIQIQIRII